MVKRYKQWDKLGFAKAFHNYPWRCKITEFHMHHTFIPSHKHYRGLRTIQGMARYHISHNKWSDIGQHISIAPDGTIWEGRNWNKKPVSIRGRNGTNRKHGFACEIIGNFDKGNDKLEGKQLETVIFTIAFIQDRLGLSTNNLVFHREYAKKSCPGTSISKSKILEQVEDYKNKNFR